MEITSLFIMCINIVKISDLLNFQTSVFILLYKWYSIGIKSIILQMINIL